MIVRVKDITITVGNRKRGDRGAYVGRPTVLGNPFPQVTMGRVRAIDKYREWLRQKIASGDVGVCGALERLRKQAVQTKALTLVCWCAPLACHAEVIADELAKVLSTGATFTEVKP